MKNLKPLKYAGQKVMTRQQLAQALECTPDQIRSVFRNRKAQFIKGEHYYELEGGALREFKAVADNCNAFGKYTSQIILWTKAGVELICKLFGTPKAAQIFAELEREYFTSPEVEVETDAVKSLVPVVFANQRVLLSKQLAQVYNCSEDRIKDNFNANREQYVEGLHYFRLTGEALAKFKRQVGNSDLVNPQAPHLYLWTERGTMRHCKSINTPEAWAMFDKLEQNYFKGAQQNSKRGGEMACVYGMKMQNNLVKIGSTGDVQERIPEVERDSGWNVVDEHHTKKMPLKRARYEERRLHKKYSHVNVHGEYYNADFDYVKQDIDEITLTLEEVSGISDSTRAKLLVEMCHINSPLQEKLIKETANFLFGEKIF